MMAVSMIFMGEGACIPSPMPFTKSGTAISPVAPVGGFATVSQCPSFIAYQQEADPVVQRVCLSCHGSGGAGAGKMLVKGGSSTDNDVAAINFFVLRNEAVPTSSSVTVDPNNPDGTSPLLERVNGAVTHDLTLDIGGGDYAAVRDWVTQELAQTCVIDPSTGNVTVNGAPPAAPSH